MADIDGLADEGVLLVARALEAGWPRGRLWGHLRRQGWTPVQRGAWAAPGLDVDVRLRLFAAQLARPDLVASHGSAATLHHIELLREEEEFSCRPRGDGEVVVTRRGLRATTAARTVADLLVRGPRDEALVAADSALAWRTVDGRRRPPLVSPAEVARALARAGRGRARARQWLGLADPASGSPAETVARLRMRDAGLRPESQAVLVGPSGRRLRTDFLFRDRRVAVEIEGHAYHGTVAAHRHDTYRYNELAGCPEVNAVLRFTATDVLHHPRAVIATIRATLEARTRRRARTPKGGAADRSAAPPLVPGPGA
ncbi:hypothetical protein ABT160_38800 [Streptomyces sp. NPDC001941]|uniref:endonuclease domain-containing protein n=1 Tax=Streptomyces sp. NPDC001941 TaxID=3154659 RepID=UPI00332CE975